MDDMPVEQGEVEQDDVEQDEEQGSSRLDWCSGCEGCGSCGDCVSLDCGGLLIANTALASLVAVPRTPPVTQGPRSVRPLLRLVESYRLHVSPTRPPVCHLTPTCSRFGRDLLRERGLRGIPGLIGRLRECARAARAFRTAHRTP